MRWSGLAGCCALLVASQALVACGDDEDGGDGAVAGSGGSSSGSGGKAAGGSAGSKAGESSTAGTAGTFGGGAGGTAGTAGTDAGGTAGTGGTPMCTKDLDCFADTTPCTDAKCVEGKCEQVPNDEAACTDGNPCTDDACDAGACKSTNNTAECDDNNVCTDDDACVSGACTGTANTAACDDLSTCTTGDACAAGACTGTRDAVACPACDTPDNLIQNCDFSEMLTSWATGIAFEGGAATQSVVNERDVLDITAGGPNAYCVQPRQEPLSLKQGFRYKFGLVAGSDVPRDGAVALTQAYGPLYKVYSAGDAGAVGGFKIALAEQMKPFNFEFLMKDPDDANVKLEIKVGGTLDGNPLPANKTYFDDVYLKEIKCALPADCNDANPCTDDACDAVSGKCTWTNNTVACDSDTESCTSQVCDAGECKTTTLADDAACADDANTCTSDVCKTGVCSHPSNGTCSCTMASECNDAEPCTDDTCTGTPGVCGHTNNTAVCNDQDDCTPTDVCGAGTCGGTSVCFDCTAGGNLVLNCGFTTMLTSWEPAILFEGAAASQTVDAKGRLILAITNGGPNVWNIQPRQAGIVLEKNKKYVVKFNAMATVARKMTIGVTQDAEPYLNYGKLDANLTTSMQLFTFPVDMTDKDPPVAKMKLEMLMGGAADNPAANTITLDNFSITEVVAP